VIDFFGPVTIKKHDATMYAESGLDGRMHALSQKLNYNLAAYGDPAYARGTHIKHGYGGLLDQVKTFYNTNMNPHRQAVENIYGLVVRDWKYIDNWKVLKTKQAPVGVLYHVAVILANLKTLRHGNNVVQRYCMYDDLPSWEDYLHKTVLCESLGRVTPTVTVLSDLSPSSIMLFAPDSCRDDWRFIIL